MTSRLRGECGRYGEKRAYPRALCARTLHVYVLPAVRFTTSIGLPVPVAVREMPPSVDVQVAEYFGVESGLPFACAAGEQRERHPQLPGRDLGTVGFAARAGAPTMSAGDAVDAALVPAAFVALTVQV